MLWKENAPEASLADSICYFFFPPSTLINNPRIKIGEIKSNPSVMGQES